MQFSTMDGKVFQGQQREPIETPRYDRYLKQASVDSRKNYSNEKDRLTSPLSANQMGIRNATPPPLRQSPEKEYLLYKNRRGRQLRSPSPLVGLNSENLNMREAYTDRFQQDEPYITKQMVQDRLSNVFKNYRQGEESDQGFFEDESMFNLNGLQQRDYEELLYILEEYEKLIRAKRRHPKVYTNFLHDPFLNQPNKSPNRIANRDSSPSYFPDLVTNRTKMNGRFPLITEETRVSSDSRQKIQDQGKSLSERYSQAKLLQEIYDRLQEYRERDAQYVTTKPKNQEYKLKELERRWDPDVKLTYRHQRLEPIQGPGIRIGRTKPSQSINSIQHLREQILLQQNHLLQNLLYNQMLRNSNDQVLLNRGNIKTNLYHPHVVKKTHPRKRIRRYLWAMVYPTLLDNYAETEIPIKLREIQEGVESLRNKMEMMLISHFTPPLEAHMIEWRDDHQLIYQPVLQPNVQPEQIENTRIVIEDEIVKIIKEVIDRTTTATSNLENPDNPQTNSNNPNSQVKGMPEAIVLYLANCCTNKVLPPNHFLSLFEMRRLFFSPKYGKLLINGKIGRLQAQMVLTMTVFLRIFISRILLKPEQAFPKVFRQSQSVHPSLRENMKFISSIIYQTVMDLYHEKLDQIFLEENEKNAKFTTHAGPLILTGISHTQLSEEDIIIGLYSKSEIKDRMKSDLDYAGLKRIFLNWSETLLVLLEKVWQATASEVQKWKSNPKQKRALEMATKDPLLKNAVYRAILRPL